jgi:hypothetical protein
VDLGLVNWGTFAGAVCFVIGGFLQLFERPAPAPAVTAGGAQPGRP